MEAWGRSFCFRQAFRKHGDGPFASARHLKTSAFTASVSAPAIVFARNILFLLFDFFGII